MGNGEQTPIGCICSIIGIILFVIFVIVSIVNDVELFSLLF